MRIASSIWVVMMCMVAAVGAWAQSPTVPDTVRYDPTAGELQRTPFERYWTKSRVAPKLGVGAMDRAFVELGIQLHSIYRHPLTLLSHGPYTTVDVFIDDSNILLGPKIGYEVTAGLFGIAADATYFIDHNYDGEGGNREFFHDHAKGGHFNPWIRQPLLWILHSHFQRWRNRHPQPPQVLTGVQS